MPVVSVITKESRYKSSGSDNVAGVSRRLAKLRILSIRRRECGTYLATARRHRRRLMMMMMKNDKYRVSFRRPSSVPVDIAGDSR